MHTIIHPCTCPGIHMCTDADVCLRSLVCNYNDPKTSNSSTNHENYIRTPSDSSLRSSSYLNYAKCLLWRTPRKGKLPVWKSKERSWHRLQIRKYAFSDERVVLTARWQLHAVLSPPNLQQSRSASAAASKTLGRVPADLWAPHLRQYVCQRTRQAHNPIRKDCCPPCWPIAIKEALRKAGT